MSATARKSTTSLGHARILPRRRSAFTLIEMLVVIAILGALLTLVMVSLQRISHNASRSQTKMVLGTLAAVSTEYRVRTDGQVPNHLMSDLSPFNWSLPVQKTNPPVAPQNGPALPPEAFVAPITAGYTGPREVQATSIERFLYAALQLDVTRDMVQTIPGEFRRDGDRNGFYEVIDSWRNKIVYAAYVRHPDADGEGDSDRSDDFLPTSNTPFFASAGSDMYWGSEATDAEVMSAYYSSGPTPDWGGTNYVSKYGAAAGAMLKRHAEDNIYSFDIE